MNSEEEGHPRYQGQYKIVKEFAEAGEKAKTVSNWFKKKIPAELRKRWYDITVVRGISEYNMLCEKWLKENVK